MSNRRNAGGLALLLSAIGLLWAGLTGSPSPSPSSGPTTPAPEPSSLGSAIVAAALASDGLCYGDSEKRQGYARHCYPGDRDKNGNPNAAALEMGGKQSSCLLHIRGSYAEAGVPGMIVYNGAKVDALRAPYQQFIGQVETLLYELAKQRGALVSSAWKSRPNVVPGDVLVIGLRSSAPEDEQEAAQWLAEWGGIAHGCLVVAVDGDTLTCVDGGQADAGNVPYSTAIATVTRKLSQDAQGRWWLGGATGRRINYQIRAAKLAPAG